MGFSCPITQRFELSCFYVGLELAIPRGSIKFGEPLAKRNELCGRKSLDLAFKIFNIANISPPQLHR